MIFAHTIDKVLSGEKTQTRRIIKPHEDYYHAELGGDDRIIPAGVFHWQAPSYGWSKPVYIVGKDYAVQRGRGIAAEGRIRITDIQREDVRNIDEIDVCAEGFSDHVEFIETWTKMHDPKFYEKHSDTEDGHYWLWRARWERPDAFYQAWVLTFALVTDVKQ